MKTTLTFLFLLGQSISIALAQPATSQPLKLGDITVSGSLRTRVESWDWFQGSANNDYTFPGSIARLSLSQSSKLLDWQIEFAAPFLLGLPDDAIAPGAQGQLGFGASYFAANHRNTNAGMVFAKQGFVRFKRLGGVEGQSLKLGRMELIDGTEVTPKDGTLAALKRDRIAHRLIGNFGFSDVGRSFDGVQYNLNRSKLNLTLFGGRPTRGVFQVDGWGELNINVLYGALTGQVGGKESAGEWRIFALGYQDLRGGVLKTDNRPVPVRIADTAHINIGTFGGHYIHTISNPRRTVRCACLGCTANRFVGHSKSTRRGICGRSGLAAEIPGPIETVVPRWIRLRLRRQECGRLNPRHVLSGAAHTKSLCALSVLQHDEQSRCVRRTAAAAI
jgi:hypothetical protein